MERPRVPSMVGSECTRRQFGATAAALAVVAIDESAAAALVTSSRLVDGQREDVLMPAGVDQLARALDTFRPLGPGSGE